MSKIKKELDKLNEKDFYSLILFALYKIIDIPEYSSISELSYVLDKNNLLNFCEYFGGTTIKVPTISEIEDIVSALMLFELVDIKQMTIEDALLEINSNTDKRKLKTDYYKIKEVLDKYEFNAR